MAGPIKPPTNWDEVKGQFNGFFALPRMFLESTEEIGKAAQESFQPNPDPHIVGKGAFDAGMNAVGMGTVFGAAPKGAFAANTVRRTDEAALPMDEAARRARAKELGHFETPFYHATTHDIKPERGFADPGPTVSPYETESYHGRAIYATTAKSDADQNYAGMGPDLTNRVQSRAERYEQDLDSLDELDREYLTEKLAELEERGIDLPRYADPLAFTKAYDDLVGKNPDGVTHKLSLNPQNPVYLGAFEGKPVTRWEAERPYVDQTDTGEFVVYNGKGEEAGRFADEDEAYGLSDELYGNDTDNPLAKIREELAYYNPAMADDVFTRAMDYDGVSASELEDWVRNNKHIHDVSDDDGNMLSPGQILQSVYRALGHDGVVMPGADKTFPGMNIPPGTTHTALFDNRRVRDYDKAEFDPKKKDSSSLLASVTGLSVPAGIAVSSEDER